MKKRLFKGTFICALALAMACCFLIGTIGNSFTAPVYAVDTDINGRTKKEAKEYNALKKHYSDLGVLFADVEDYGEEILKEKYKEQTIKAYYKYHKGKYIAKETVKQLKDAKNWVDLAKAGAKGAVDWIENGANADHAENVYNIAKSVTKIVANCFGPVYGIVAEGAFEILETFAAIGEESESEIKQLQNHLDKKFDEIDVHIDEVQRDISELSKKVDSQTAELLSALSDALEANYAKKEVNNFLTSSDGNFDYTLFKDILYASADPTNEDYSANAYYFKLQEALANDANDALLKDCYDNLYKYLNVSDLRTEKTPTEKLFEAMMGNELGTKESIQYYYFGLIDSNSESLDESDIPAFDAIDFTYDLYTTALMADYVIGICNAYQILNMSRCDNRGRYVGELRYYYGSGDNDYVTYNDILANDIIIQQREEALFEQILEDITRFLRIDESYIFESSDGIFRTSYINDEGTFGKVQKGDTIYLNTYISDFCKLFDIDENNIEYAFECDGVALDHNDAIHTVTSENGKTVIGSVSYEGIPLYSISFDVGDNTHFAGGDGSEENPYIISTPEQFKLIYSTEDYNKKHYELERSIDLENTEIKSLCDDFNKFDGSFNGNGYTISNFRISDSKY